MPTQSLKYGIKKKTKVIKFDLLSFAFLMYLVFCYEVFDLLDLLREWLLILVVEVGLSPL